MVDRFHKHVQMKRLQFDRKHGIEYQNTSLIGSLKCGKLPDYELLMNQSLGLGSNESLLPTASGSSWDDLQDVKSHGF
jgi:hypothetical protein